MDSEYMPRKRRSKKQLRRGGGKRRAKKRRIAMRNLRKAWRANRKRSKTKRKKTRRSRKTRVAFARLRRHKMPSRSARSYRFKTSYYQIGKGLTKREALHKTVRQHRRDFRGFTYNPKTGRAAIV